MKKRVKSMKSKVEVIKILIIVFLSVINMIDISNSSRLPGHAWINSTEGKTDIITTIPFLSFTL
jgi:hypothetical protein